MVHADVSSANIVGYGHFTVPNGYSIWGPVFKNIGSEVFYLSQITPCTPKGKPIVGDGLVTLQILSATGSYGKSYAWRPSLGGWSLDGQKIKDTDVPLNPGEGFAMINNLWTNDETGEEGAGRGCSKSPATMLCSGEVDLVCQNTVPNGYSISGNSTPVVIYLSQITPCTPKGKPIVGDGLVTLQILSATGSYGKSYAWRPSLGGWSLDGQKIKDTDVPLNPGEGFAMINNLWTNDETGEEGAGRGCSKSPAVMALPCPIAK